MSSSEKTSLEPRHRELLLDVARRSVEYGVEHGRALPVSAADYPAPLGEQRATFVTLRVRGALRGCIGTCLPIRPLIEDVAHNAYAAAFHDPRFPAMTRPELADLHIHISLLTVPEPMQFTSEEDLLARIRPGVDGLLLEEGFNKGTLLPAVWEMLPEAREFLRHLKMKAGLPPDHWSDRLSISRYTAESIEEE